jgi:hypothetical protein
VYISNSRHGIISHDCGDDLAGQRERPPRVWRVNFYRTNVFATGQV